MSWVQSLTTYMEKIRSGRKKRKEEEEEEGKEDERMEISSGGNLKI